jgi:hypothetical protein
MAAHGQAVYEESVTGQLIADLSPNATSLPVGH